MSEIKSFARSLLQDSAEPEETRDAFVKERQSASQAFNLRLRFKDGRKARGFPWSLYSDDEWQDNGKAEQLTLNFSKWKVSVDGEQLWRLIEKLDEGQLKAIQEHDSREAELLRAENADLKREHKKAIVYRIHVEEIAAEGEDA